MSQDNIAPAPGHHVAAVTFTKGTPLEIISRPTPTPGPSEVLIAVSSIALNRIDYYQRDFHFPPITHSPAVLGSDLAGTIVSVGSSVPSGFTPGTRVFAFAVTYYEQGKPDYGAFQKMALVPYQAVTPIPSSLGFNEASVLPMAFHTTMVGFMYQLGLPRDVKGDGKGILIWGAGSSVGIGAVILAKLMGFKSYATASPQHHDYLKSIGATRLFDYKDPNVVNAILASAKEDGLSFKLGYLGIGDLKPCLDVLKTFRKGDEVLRVAHAPRVPDDAVMEDGIEVQFIAPPDDKAARQDHYAWASAWLREKVFSGDIVSCGAVELMEGGLGGLNNALDKLRDKGVNGAKIVLEI